MNPPDPTIPTIQNLDHPSVPDHPEFEWFPENPTPYTIDALRWYIDIRGDRHYW